MSQALKQMVFFADSFFEHFSRLVALGILDAPEFEGRWQLRILPPPRKASEMAGLLSRLSPSAAVIFRLERDLVSMLLKHKIPCVVVDDDTHPWANIPVIEIDHEAVGRLAADYFLERRHYHFAVARTSERALFAKRQRGFVRRLAKSKYSCNVFLMPGGEGITKLFHTHRAPLRTRKWLLKLPKPCAIFATNDAAGLHIIEACHELGIRVPEDVAVLGVDNTILICRTAPTPLSSVSVPFEEQGRKAARLLCNWNAANPPGRSIQQLAPLEVVSRSSTTSLSAHDPIVARALDYIERHISEPFRVRDLKALTAVSTPTLVARFRQELSLTPIEVVRRERIRYAKRMLLENNDLIGTTAKNCGFGSLERFCKVFREMVGQTPLQYRQSVRET